MSTTKNFTRRQFLKSTAAIGAAPLILPAHVWAAQTKPGNRITLGFIGVGKQGRGLLGGFMNSPETQVVAVCDVDTTRREHAKKTVEDFYAKRNDSSFKGCAAYNDFRELLARKDIDAVVIATPDHWHAYIAIAAANAGKDIYCEKPLTQSIHEARSLVDAVRRNQRVFQTGSQQRSSKEFRTAAELIRNNRLGKLERVEVSIGGPGKMCDLPAETEEPGLDWDMWLGPAPRRPYHSELSPRGLHNHFPNWRLYREYGSGMVTDWGAHHFDITQWALGMDESGPVELFPAAAPNAQEGARYTYANGVEVLHKSGNGIWFFGTEGKLYVNRGKFELWLGNEQKAKSPNDCDAVARELLPEGSVRVYHSNDHRGDWLNCIRTRQRPICDVEVGARSVTVCHLVNLTYYHGQRIKWDPARNQFTGGTGNPVWLDIPHRDKWKV